MSKVTLLSVSVLLLVFAGRAIDVENPGMADDALPEGTEAIHGPHAFLQDHEFIGASRCRTCHRKEEDGDQYGKWEAGPHSKAYTVLASDEAKTVAAERGIDNPQTAEECLRCHVTAYNAPAERLGSKYTVEEGVGCESCHGAGGDYYKKSTMEGISAGEIDPASVGLVIPTEETCLQCHNEESPTFKGFNFEEASQEIAHPYPDDRGN